jgi:hypothetical protein
MEKSRKVAGLWVTMVLSQRPLIPRLHSVTFLSESTRSEKHLFRLISYRPETRTNRTLEFDPGMWAVVEEVVAPKFCHWAVEKSGRVWTW